MIGQVKTKGFLDMDLRSLIILAVVLSAGAAGGPVISAFISPQTFRPDPFTGTDSKDLKREIQLELQIELLKLDKQLPPEKTRQRIRDLERAMEDVHPSYKPPTTQWSEH